jgi:hypothetical protein
MKTTRNVLFALLLLGGAAGAASAATSVAADIHVGPSGRASVDLGFFYDDLASYGNWIDRPSYGWVWTPRAVSTSWRPYQAGHWVWTDEGWAWISDEPYGWATYHYGRWYDDPEIGWSWVPGSDWSPAWVSWQEGSNYIGWAPLPPSVQINPGFSGLLSVTLAPDSYVFVQERYFLAPRITTYIVPRERIVNVYRETRNVTNYRYSGDRIYNNGVSVDQIQRVVGRPVTRYQIADLSAAQRRNGARVQGNRVEIFRPQVQRAASVQPPSARPAARRAVVDATQFRQSHPDRAARRAEAQGVSQPGNPPAQTQPNPAQRTDRANRNPQNPQTQGARPRSRGQDQVQPEATPPARQRQTPQPAPDQPQRQRPQAQERRQRQPATEQQPPPERQRPPQDNPPPQRQQRQVEPQRQPQRQPQQPSPQQQKQQRQQEKKNRDKEQQPPPPPPPSR